jgi:hypothetical protein
MQRIFPVLSSSVAGPLGVKHLPRLWLKILLSEKRLLPDGYRCGEGGFDGFLTSTLGIDSEAFQAYIREQLPDYPTLEAWVRAHATNLTPEAIATVNDNVATADLPERMRADRFARVGLHDESYVKAVALNDLDDWAGMHEELLRVE